MTPSCILFDFFGTLVSYSDSRTEQGYEESHALLRKFGSDLGYDAFLDLWVRTSEQYDEAADRETGEFAMTELTTGFLRVAVGREPDAKEARRFADVYISEWNRGVVYFEGIDAFLDRLGRGRRLGIVTNTHDGGLIDGHLDAMGVRDRFDTIVTSLELRCRKPKERIFHKTALERIGASVNETWFIGDSVEADYQGAQRVGMKPVLIDPKRSEPSLERVSHLFEIEGMLG